MRIVVIFENLYFAR